MTILLSPPPLPLFLEEARPHELMTYQKLYYEEPKVELFSLRAHGYSILLNFSFTGEVDEFEDYEQL